jgi:hypothetical protein
VKRTRNFDPEVSRKSATWKYKMKEPGAGSILILDDPSFEVVECWKWHKALIICWRIFISGEPVGPIRPIKVSPD